MTDTTPDSFILARPVPAAAGRRVLGFTLVEAILVIVVTAAIAAVVAVFIRAPVEGYADAAARAELTDAADLALRRIARDIRLALPNSVRIVQPNANEQYLELLPTKIGGRYLSVDDGVVAGDALSFTNVGDLTFDVVGAMPADTQAIVPGDFIVVYNLDAQDPGSPVNAYAGGNRAQVAGVAGNTVTLLSNPFAAQVPSIESPGRRFQVITTPVTYRCLAAPNGGGVLTRYWGYPIQAAQPQSAATAPLQNAASAPLVQGVSACNFVANALPNLQSALVSLSLVLESPDGRSGRVRLTHQVHVDNTP